VRIHSRPITGGVGEVAARHAILGRGHDLRCTVIVAAGATAVCLQDGPAPRSNKPTRMGSCHMVGRAGARRAPLWGA